MVSGEGSSMFFMVCFVCSSPSLAMLPVFADADSDAREVFSEVQEPDSE